ncbi:MAG: DUF3604 domain-containing protein [Planctomycetes bacterium]|nr:DUF3604 domain-containing protein [Planctomycetota bacterium]
MLRTSVLPLLVLAACSPSEPERNADAESAAAPAPSPWPATARVDTHDEMVASAKREFHPADGGGKAWLEHATRATCHGRFSATIVYAAGELGVAEGGVVALQVSPFWGWSTPQTENPSLAGFTRVATDAEGVALHAETLGAQLLGVRITGRALAAGEHVRFEYGAGERAATADNFAELDSRFWIAVDGDGDGVRKVLADSPTVAVEPEAPAGAVAHAPSVLRPGEPARVRIGVLDRFGNACRAARATVRFVEPPEGLEVDLAGSGDTSGAHQPIEFAGSGELTFRLRAEGTYRLKVNVTLAETSDASFDVETNPIVVGEHAPRIYWADLHGHSGLSDGTGTPEHYYEYARDFAALDVVALTDHDHWGLLPLSQHPELVREIVDAARAAERPGAFTALVGFEWTSWLWGHRNVVWFDERDTILSSLDERFDAPDELRAALRGQPAISIPHHPAGGPIALDWSTALDTEVEPLVEICSAHGVSEALDSPAPIYAAVREGFARDALERGARFGVLASGDSHDGHPGLCHLGGHYPTGGVAAVLAESNTRESLLAALRARRVYATSGPRIVLRVAIANHRMGEIVAASEVAGEVPLYVNALGTAPIATIEVVRKGDRTSRIEGTGQSEFALGGTLSGLVSGDWVYVRVTQTDGGLAWSSPIFVR